jgi:hypothetical protein
VPVGVGGKGPGNGGRLVCVVTRGGGVQLLFRDKSRGRYSSKHWPNINLPRAALKGKVILSGELLCTESMKMRTSAVTVRF